MAFSFYPFLLLCPPLGFGYHLSILFNLKYPLNIFSFIHGRNVLDRAILLLDALPLGFASLFLTDSSLIMKWPPPAHRVNGL